MASQSQEQIINYKIVLVGPSRVGKTTLSNRISRDQFQPHFYSTVGVEFFKKNFCVKDKSIQLNFWDTSGQPRFAPLLKVYLRNCEALLLTFDVTNKKSYFELQNWISLLKNKVEYDLSKQFIILGNKSQCQFKNKISKQRVMEDFKDYKCKFFEVSAKAGEGIEEFLEYMKEKAYQKGFKEQKQDSQKIFQWRRQLYCD